MKIVGWPVLEAMANGLAVVASCTASLPEVGGEVAFYVDPHDLQDFMEKVGRAVEDSELRRKMIRQGLKRAREFSWRRVAEATLRVYEEALGIDDCRLPIVILSPDLSGGRISVLAFWAQRAATNCGDASLRSA
jgi:RNA 3'-terminal phosphate cyclase